MPYQCISSASLHHTRVMSEGEAISLVTMQHDLQVMPIFQAVSSIKSRDLLKVYVISDVLFHGMRHANDFARGACHLYHNEDLTFVPHEI